MQENLSVWDLTHKKFDDNLEFMNLNSESFSTNFWALSQGLGEHTIGFRVLELDSLDSSKVEEVSRSLIVASIDREVGLNNELSSLLIKVL